MKRALGALVVIGLIGGAVWIGWNSRSPRYDLEGVTAALAGRGITLEPGLLEQVSHGRSMLMPREFKFSLAARLDPSLEIVSTHFGEITAGGRLQLDGEPMYVAEITGSDTGNCINLYDPYTGKEKVGACFYAERSSP